MQNTFSWRHSLDKAMWPSIQKWIKQVGQTKFSTTEPMGTGTRYNPSKAKQLLKESGVSLPIHADFYSSNDASRYTSGYKRTANG
ncbi:hypothetical protein GCM10025859_15840 [Alicyclobacillus fastidiosus]|nr:hypothetical protein GCM10025859_15840 [Alicyclobacillus fastidiosus]